MRKNERVRNCFGVFLAIILVISCFLNMYFEINASEMNNIENTKVYYETSKELLKSNKSNLGVPTIEMEKATITKSQDLKSLGIQTIINGYSYKFQVKGVSEKIDNGAIGLYQGYIVPNANDQILNSLNVDSKGVLVSIYHIQCEDDDYFTMSLGEISEHTNPIVKIFGEQTDKISAVISKKYENSLREQELFKSESIEGGVRATTVDAEIRCKLNLPISGSNGNTVGRLTFYHANEIENQNTMTTRIKMNTNTAGANAYAMDYFDLSSDYEVSSLATQVVMSIRSSNAKLHVSTNAYAPQTGEKRVELPIPYLSGGSVKVKMLNFLLSSVNAQTSGGNFGSQNISWTMNHSSGFPGLDGDQNSQTGLPGEAAYTYEGTVSSSLSAYFTASGRITYTAYIENSRLGTITPFPLTTKEVSDRSNITILP